MKRLEALKRFGLPKDTELGNKPRDIVRSSALEEQKSETPPLTDEVRKGTHMVT